VTASSARRPGASTRLPLPPVEFSGRGMTLTSALKTLLTAKLARLGRTLPQILDARVVCSAEKFRRTVRITLRGRRRTFASEATASEFAAAIDAAVDALRRQTREAKSRRTVSKGRAPRRSPAEPVV
jgi:ribosomal subunit interface protein